MIAGDQVLYNWGSNIWLSGTIAMIGENAIVIAVLVPNVALKARGMQPVPEIGGRILFLTAAPAPMVLLMGQQATADGAGVWTLKGAPTGELDFGPPTRHKKGKG